MRVVMILLGLALVLTFIPSGASGGAALPSSITVAGMQTPEFVLVLVPNVQSPADIGYDRRRDRVLIPIFQGNQVVIQPLK